MYSSDVRKKVKMVFKGRGVRESGVGRKSRAGSK